MALKWLHSVDRAVKPWCLKTGKGAANGMISKYLLCGQQSAYLYRVEGGPIPIDLDVEAIPAVLAL